MRITQSNVLLVLFTIVAAAVAVIFLVKLDSTMEREPFNKTPESCRKISNNVCRGISENLSIISKEKLETTFKEKYYLYGSEYSKDDLKKRHPEDVVVEMNGGDNNPFIIVLTRNWPLTKDYFLRK